MPSYADGGETGYRAGSPRQRLISSLLSAGIIVAALLVALYQTAVAPQLAKRRNPVTFSIEGDDADTGSKTTEKAPKATEKAKDEPERSQVRVEAPVTHVITPTEAPEKPAFSFLKMSRADMAAADIGAMKRDGNASAGLAKGSAGSSYGPGEGPGGAVLYNADWYREPTDAQLAGYLNAASPPAGWGMIACQTMAHYKVDNCQILGESPRGSGFGRAVLNAAWQFQVIPPRINGKPQIGEWVRIRIEYGTGGAAASG